MRTAYSRFRQVRSHRRPLSLLGSLLYALCAIALPSLHLGLHRADHEHRDGGLQLLPTRLGAHHALVLPPHSHGTGLYHEHLDDRARQDAGASASAETGSQNSLNFAALPPAPGACAIKETPTHATHPGSAMLGVAGHAQHGSPAPDPGHGSGSLVHFASALVTTPSSIGLPLAGLLCEQTRYLARSECAPRSSVISAKHARGPPAPVAAI